MSDRPSVAQSPEINLVYIAGYGRSGSTLLEKLLGQVADVEPLGELFHVWERGFALDQLCSCGMRFSECVFWKHVAQAFSASEVEEIRLLLRRIVRFRRIGQLSGTLPTSSDDVDATDRLREGLRRFYEIVQRVSGGTILIDSSKNIPYAMLLSTIEGINIHVVHLVRDSRAVAYSWTRKKVRTEIVARETYMDQFPPFSTATKWTAQNIGAELLKRHAHTYTMLRYEDFVNAPSGHLARVLKHAGLRDGPDLSFIEGQKVFAAASHTASGNPMRFKVGEIVLRPDDEWQSKLPLVHRAMVTSLTAPLLLRYRFPLGPGDRPHVHPHGSGS